ncbi:MAG: hypothetical protein ACTHWH_16020 [Marinobacter sp.]
MDTTENYRASAPVAGTGTVHRVSWGAIIAGAVIAVALMTFFTIFGIGLGAAIIDPQFDQNLGEGVSITAGIYLVVTQLIALGAGGFVAARMAGIPRTISSLLHGASVWAVTTVFIAWMSVIGAGTMFGAAGSLMGGTASSATSAIKAVVPDNISLPDPSKLADQLSLDDLPDEIQTSLRENGITEENLRSEANAAFRDVFSQREQEAAVAEAKATIQDMVTSPGDIGSDLDAFADDMVGGPNAIISEEDRQQALTTLEERLGITPQEAEQVVVSVEDGIDTAIKNLRETVNEAQAKAIEVAQSASDALSSIALWLTLASLLGLAVACGGAFGGRPSSLIGDRQDDHL